MVHSNWSPPVNQVTVTPGSVRGHLWECPLTRMCKYRFCMGVQTGFCEGECPLGELPLY